MVGGSSSLRQSPRFFPSVFTYYIILWPWLWMRHVYGGIVTFVIWLRYMAHLKKGILAFCNWPDQIGPKKYWALPEERNPLWGGFLLLLLLPSKMCCAMLSCFSGVWLFATLWTIACQAPVSMGFSRQEYPPPGTQGSNPHLLWLLNCRQFFTAEPAGKATFEDRDQMVRTSSRT